MSVISYMRDLGIIGNSFLASRGGIYGAVFPIILVSLSIGDRINVLKQQRSAAVMAEQNLRNLDAMKTRFLTNISHEVRTPLQLIVEPIRNVMEGRYGEALSRHNSVFGIMYRNCQRLSNLINNVLNFSQIDLADVHEKMEPTDIISCVRTCFAMANSAADTKGILYSLNCSGIDYCPVHANPQLLESAFLNLIYNAIKFTPSGGTVSVVVRKEARNDGYIKIQFRDTGIGIPENKIEEVFNRYVQLEKPTMTDNPGLGLGLSIVKEIIEKHGGRIIVKSEENKGSIFEVSMPTLQTTDSQIVTSLPQDRDSLAVAPSAPSQEDADYPEGEVTPSRAILLVEDNADMMDYLSGHLSQKYRIVTAYNGHEALSALRRSGSIDLVLSDIMMPKMDGRSLLLKLRQNRAYHSLPFIFLTAKTDAIEQKMAYKNGAIDFVIKPFQIDTLIAKIDRLLDFGEEIRESHANDLDRAHEIEIDELCKQHQITPRERQVIELLIHGKSQKEISSLLHISRYTAKRHIENIYNKMHVHDRFELFSLIRKVPSTRE